MATDPSRGPRTDLEQGLHISGERELEHLGYKQELNRALSLVGNVALVVATITPATALLIIGPVALTQAGTGAFWAYLLAGAIAVCIALCFAELGSVYPTAGGQYPIVSRVLGKQVGFFVMLSYAVAGVFVPATIALGFGPYLATILPGVGPNLASTAVVVAATGVATLSISDNAWVTKVIVTLELILLGGLLVLGISSIRQPISVLFDPVAVSQAGSVTTTVGLALIFSAVTTGLFSYSGYEVAITFSEETQGEAQQIGRGVMIAATISILFQVLPLAAVILAAPNLGEFLRAEAPFTYVVESVIGPTGNVIVTIGILFAIFAAVQSLILAFARFLYATGRDRAWPAVASGSLTKISERFTSPWIAALVVGGLTALLTFFSDVALAVTFIGVLIAVNYGLIAVSALVSRIRRPDLHRPWRMSLWPVPPLVALIGVGIALSQQRVVDLAIVAGIVAAGAVYYVLFLRPRRSYWRDPEGLSAEAQEETAQTERQNG
jgi:amino acid transporter